MTTPQELEKATRRNTELELALLKAEGVLNLIACEKRPDGTYNRDREACRQLAVVALLEISKILYDFD